MPCKFYNSQFACGGCCHFTKSIAIAVNGGFLDITIPERILRNREKLCIALCQNIPETIAPLPVRVVIAGTTPITIDAVTPCGNLLYSDQLRSRKVLHLHAATDTPALVAQTSNLCRTAHNFPTIPAPAPAPTPTPTSLKGEK